MILESSAMDLSPTRVRRSTRGLSAGGQRLTLRRRQHLGEIVGDGCQARRHFPLGLLRQKQLVRDVKRRQNRGLVRLYQRTLTQHFLQRLIDVSGDFARVLGSEVRPDGVLFSADHHANGVLLRRHLCPPLSRACSSKNESRCMRSWTRLRAPSTRCRSALFSDSSSGFLTGPPRDFNSDSAFWARERQPATPPRRHGESFRADRWHPARHPAGGVGACRRRTPNSPSSAVSIRLSSASISRSVSVRTGSRNVQRHVTPRVPAGKPFPRYSSSTSSRSSNVPPSRRSTAATAAAVTAPGTTRDRSRTTGG